MIVQTREKLFSIDQERTDSVTKEEKSEPEAVETVE